jgi:DNA polymerase-3 subunit epsilon
LSSICQIGIAGYNAGGISVEWKSYVDPEDFFDGINVSIHGIDESVVKGAPTFKEIAATLRTYLDNKVVVCHTHFDRVAISQACDKYETANPSCVWLDSAKVARRTWEEFAYRGYGLDNVCASLGYIFKHHDALEDAKAAAYILRCAVQKTALDIEGWLRRVKQPIHPSNSGSYSPIHRDGNPEGPFYGEVLVFTGALQLPRREAANMADSVGCQVDARVTKQTKMLVVGDQDIKKLAGHEKSSKHRKAEKLISLGQSLRILRETDFKQIVNLAD